MTSRRGSGRRGQRSCTSHTQRAVDGCGDLVGLSVHLVLREPVHPPAVVDQPRVATGIAEHTLGAGVVAALVLDADAVLGIGQVEPDGSSAPVVQNGVLRLRAWKAAEYEDQPQPGLHRGSGTSVGEVDSSGQRPAPPRAGVPLRERQHAVRWETADAGECVESDDGLDRIVGCEAAHQVVRSARARRDVHSAASVDLVGGQGVPVHEQARVRALPAVRDGHLGRRIGRRARGVEQFGRGVPGDHASAGDVHAGGARPHR
jgi:hypothetical protein